jgi:hypothetical protein
MRSFIVHTLHYIRIIKFTMDRACTAHTRCKMYITVWLRPLRNENSSEAQTQIEDRWETEMHLGGI